MKQKKKTEGYYLIDGWAGRITQNMLKISKTKSERWRYCLNDVELKISKTKRCRARFDRTYRERLI